MKPTQDDCDKCEVEYVIKVNKVWINKAKSTGSKFRLYGTSLKILQMVTFFFEIFIVTIWW